MSRRGCVPTEFVVGCYKFIIFLVKKMKFFGGKHKGFTLIELLIVVAIIGILAAVGMGGVFLRSREAARDGRRVADIKQIQTAFEQYFAVNGQYANCSTMFADSSIFPAGAPEGPLGEDYADGDHCTTATATEYCICVETEREDRANSWGDGCVYVDPEDGTDLSHYCAVNLQ